MQVLLALRYYATGSYCLVMVGYTPGASTDASTRTVKALCGMALLGSGNVVFPTSDVRGVSTVLLAHIKY